MVRTISALAACTMLLFAASRAAAEETRLPDAPPAVAPIMGLREVSAPADAPGYPGWSQGDSRWRDAPLGSRTVGQIGCLLTVIGMVFHASGVPASPDLLSQAVQRGRLLVGNLLRFRELLAAYGFRESERVAVRSRSAAVDLVNRSLASGRHVILELSRGGRPHFVLASSPGAGDFHIVDPDGGRSGSFSSLYGDRGSVRIVGVRVIERA